MKKVLIGTMLLAATSFAGKYGAAGCGLGSMILGDQGGFMQVFAATTNGTSGNQTFGITSGTLNCADDGVALEDKEMQMFVEANIESLKQEMAQGQGENLDVLAGMYGFENDSAVEFSSKVQSNYDAIVTSDAVTPSELIANINAVM